MPKNITQLAHKFSKIVVGQASKEELESFTQGSQRVLVPLATKKYLSELVELLTTRGISADQIKAAWKLMMVDGQETANGVEVASGQLHAMLQALAAAWKALEGIGDTKDIQKINDIYEQVSQLKAPTQVTPKVKTKIPYNEDVKIAQNHLWRNGYAAELERAGGVDGILGQATIGALKKYLPDYSVEDAIAYCVKREQGSSSQDENPTLPRPGIIHEDPWANPHATTGVGKSDASQLARKFSKIIGN